MATQSPTRSATRTRNARAMQRHGWTLVTQDEQSEVWSRDGYELTVHYNLRPNTVSAIELGYSSDSEIKYVHVARNSKLQLRGEPIGGYPSDWTTRQLLLVIAANTDLTVWLHEEDWWRTGEYLAEDSRLANQNVSPTLSNDDLGALGRKLTEAGWAIASVNGKKKDLVVEAAAAARAVIDQITAALPAA